MTPHEPARARGARPRAPILLSRALARRCPRCGQRGIFRGWFSMAERCPGCGLAFERGEGYWLGAIAINLGVTELVFGAIAVTWAVLAWPDVPWVPLLVVSLAANAIVPIAFYPLSKTLFVAADLLMHRMDPRDADPR